MVGSTSILHRPAGVAVGAVVGVAARWLTAFVFEASTDRDWTLRGSEWHEVVAFAVLFVLGTVWALSMLMPRVRTQRPASVGARRAERDKDAHVQLRSGSASRR